MQRSERTGTGVAVGACSAVALLVALALVACTPTSTTSSDDVPPDPSAPPPWSLTSPDNAVISYLHWISFAYRIGNSDVASQTFTPWEEVRVNSYVQHNRQQGRAIDQTLTGLQVDVVSVVENTATVTAHEEWSYRYISLATGRYAGPAHTATYESTYTVVREPDGLWRVGKVEASSTIPVE